MIYLSYYAAMDVEKILAIVGGIAVVGLGLGGLYAYIKRGSDENIIVYQSREIDTLTSYNAQLEKKVERLTAENESLKRENDAFRSNPLVLENIVAALGKMTVAFNKQTRAVVKLTKNINGNGKS